jgi:hypothetical protein
MSKILEVVWTGSGQGLKNDPLTSTLSSFLLDLREHACWLSFTHQWRLKIDTSSSRAVEFLLWSVYQLSRTASYVDLHLADKGL